MARPIQSADKSEDWLEADRKLNQDTQEWVLDPSSNEVCACPK